MRKPQAQIAPVRLPLYSAKREKVGELEVSGMVFGRGGENTLLHEAVRMQLANRRAGNAATKTRGLISGGGRKPWRQKGTGRARAGSTRSPIWRHGGTTFGPQPRDYSYKIPKRAWRQALCMAISDRASAGKLKVIDSLELAFGIDFSRFVSADSGRLLENEPAGRHVRLQDLLDAPLFNDAVIG